MVLNVGIHIRTLRVVLMKTDTEDLVVTFQELVAIKESILVFPHELNSITNKFFSFRVDVFNQRSGIGSSKE